MKKAWYEKNIYNNDLQRMLQSQVTSRFMKIMAWPILTYSNPEY